MQIIRVKAVVAIVCSLVATGCVFPLEVRNLKRFRSPAGYGLAVERAPTLGILPFQGREDDAWYFDAIVRRLIMDPGIAQVRAPFHPRLVASTGFRPDLLLEVDPHVRYSSSAWNFLINFPGFLIFTPGWHGYVYRARIDTSIAIRDLDGALLDEIQVPLTYDLRHADTDRAVWTWLTWLEVGAMAFFGGIYNAAVFDRDLIDTLYLDLRGDFPQRVVAQLQMPIQAAAAIVAERRSEPLPEGESVSAP